MPLPDKGTIREASVWFARMHAADADDHRAAFDAWLAADEVHRDAYSRVSEAFSLGKNLARDPVSRHGKRSRRRLAPAMALTALTVGAVTLLVDRRVMPRTDDALMTADARPIRTRIGEIRSVRLSDGSTVTLDTDSRLATRFGTRGRDLWLSQGRARFDVAHEQRPFTVHAGGGTVTAHGTIFDVRVQAGAVSVRLIRGAIDVRSLPRTDGPSQIRRVLPGQVVAFHMASTVTVMPATRAAEIAPPTWTDKLLDFADVRVADLAVEANRYSAAHLIVSDPRVADLRVSGTFRVGDPHRLADRLAALLDLHTVPQPNGDVALSRKIMLGQSIKPEP